jgi:hypothetical protein
LAGGLEVICRPSSNVPPRPATVEEAAGAATAVLSRGADVIYLFNYFQDGHPGWPVPEYQRILKTFSSLDELSRLSRRHVVTYRDVVAPGETYRPPLPANGSELSFSLPLGPAPPPSWQAEATIELSASPAGAAPPTLGVNGVAGQFRTDEAAENGNRRLVYTIPLSALPGRNSDTITLKADAPVEVLRVEVRLHPAE